MSEIDLGLGDPNGGRDTAMGHTHTIPRSTRRPFDDALADNGWVKASHDGSSRSFSSSSSSDDDDDNNNDDADDGSRVLGGLPLVPSAGGRSIDPISAVPRRVTASLTSLRSIYKPARRRARHFSPISKRLSRSEPHAERAEVRRLLRAGSPPHIQDESLTHIEGDHQPTHVRSVDFAPATSPRNSDRNNSKNRQLHTEPFGIQSANDHVTSRNAGQGSSGTLESGYDDVQVRRLTRHAERLRAERTTVSDLIGSLRTLRVHARQRRKEQNTAELAFLNAAREELSTHPNLLKLLNKMQQTHNQQLEAELRIDEVVEDLHQAEKLLDIRERIFFSAASGADVSFAESDTDSGRSDGDFSPARRKRRQRPEKQTSHDLIGISGRRPPTLHPMLSKLHRVVRDLRLTEEHLANLDARKEHLDGVVKSWHALDHSVLRRFAEDANSLATFESKSARTLTKDETDFLHSYESNARVVSAEIDQLRDEMSRLQSECRKRGVVGKDELLPGEQADHDDSDTQEIDLDDYSRTRAASGSSPLKHPQFPLLLTNPSSLLEDEPQTPQQALRNAWALPRTHPNRQRKINDIIRERNIDMLLQGPERKITRTQPDTLSEQNIEKFIQESTRQGTIWKSPVWVNRWLLHKLQLSALEATVLYNTTQQYYNVRQLIRWQIFVFQFWPKDLDGPRHQSDRSITGSSVAIYFRSSTFPISRRKSESDLPTVFPSRSRGTSRQR